MQNSAVLLWNEEAMYFAKSPFAAYFNRGKAVSELVESIDVMPTLCEMIGLALPAQGIQGQSLAPLVSGKAAAWKNRVFAERGSMMIRTPQYKLIKNDARDLRRGGSEFELYDMTRDPGEKRNLIADSAYAGIVAELKAQLDAWQKDIPPVPVIEGVKLSQQPESGAERPPKDRPKKARKKQ